MTCERCNHSSDSHTDGICTGDTYCLCTKFEGQQEEIAPNPLSHIKQAEVDILKSRTDIPLPQPITTHDNWG
ncbi:MAG: hypothetical protein ACW99F_14385 [Candidatus Hodarchaeales archaeon]|jgi:hypothetical protein